MGLHGATYCHSNEPGPQLRIVKVRCKRNANSLTCNNISCQPSANYLSTVTPHIISRCFLNVKTTTINSENEFN